MPGIDVPELSSQPLRESWSPVVGIDVPEMIARPAMSELEGLSSPDLREWMSSEDSSSFLFSLS